MVINRKYALVESYKTVKSWHKSGPQQLYERFNQILNSDAFISVHAFIHSCRHFVSRRLSVCLKQVILSTSCSSLFMFHSYTFSLIEVFRKMFESHVYVNSICNIFWQLCINLYFHCLGFDPSLGQSKVILCNLLPVDIYWSHTSTSYEQIK